MLKRPGRLGRLPARGSQALAGCTGRRARYRRQPLVDPTEYCLLVGRRPFHFVAQARADDDIVTSLQSLDYLAGHGMLAGWSTRVELVHSHNGYHKYARQDSNLQPAD